MKKKEALKYLVKNPIAVLKDGIRAQKEKFHMSSIQSKYKVGQLPTIDIMDLFPQLDETINYYSFLCGTSLVTDIILLKSLAGKYENCSYLEIGSWRGESIANVADVANDCTSLTLGEEDMRAMNISEEFIQAHGVFSKGIDNITTVKHNSHTFDFNKLNKKFDLIFIDGDHTYEGVLNDTQKVFHLRRNEKSVIVWHDYAPNNEDVRYSVLEAILDGTPPEKHKNLFHVSNTVCAIYIEDNVLDVKYTRFPTYPNKIFSLHLKAKKM